MNYYQYGCLRALEKLGMEAGPVAYATTESRDSSFADNRKQELWKSVDDEPFATGEESSIGMPSPSKVATENDGAYGAPEGSYGVGGQDANSVLPDRLQRRLDSISRGFDVNSSIDQSYAPEASNTQPFGNKMGGLINPLKIKSPMSSSVGMMGKRTSGITPKPLGMQSPLAKPMGMNIPKPGALPSMGTNIMNNMAGTAGPMVPPVGMDNAMTAASSHVGKLVR